MVACPLCRFSCPQCRFFGVLRADEKLTEHNCGALSLLPADSLMLTAYGGVP